MLKFLRKKGVMKKVLWAVAILIIISFGLFGAPGILETGGQSSAGKIFGRTISIDKFQKAYLHTRNQAILRYGDTFNKVRQYLNLERETWDRMILLHEAKRKRVKVADKDVVEFIRQQPFFQRDGVFDQFLYEDIIKYVFNCSPRDFEEGIRGTLTVKKMYDEETSFIQLSGADIEEEYTKRNERIQVHYVLLPVDQFTKDVTLADEEVKSYFEANKNAFTVPEMINIQYIALKTPAEAQKIYTELAATNDFNTIEQKYDATIEETGFFSMEQPFFTKGWSYQLLQNMFDLKENEIIPPVEVPEGFHIIRLKEKRAAHIPTYEEAKDKVQEAFKKEKARLLTRQKAHEYREELTAENLKAFAKAAKDLGLSVEETPLFKRGQYLPVIGMSEDFQEAAFALTAEERVGGPVETQNGFCILYLKERAAVDMGRFLEEKETFAQEVLDERKNEAFNDFLTRLRIKSNLVDNITESRPRSPAGNAQPT